MPIQTRRQRSAFVALHTRDALLVVLLVAFALLSSLGPAQSARAEGPAEAESPSPAYAEHIKSALSETALGNFAEAREHFRRAHAIDPSARTLRGLGMVEFELSHYVDSARFLSEALRSNVKPLSGKLRSETEALCERARQYVGSVQVVTDPSSATVIVDGAVIDLDASRTVTLPVGDHSFEVRSDGRMPAKQVVKVDGGETAGMLGGFGGVSGGGGLDASAGGFISGVTDGGFISGGVGGTGGLAGGGAGG
jgi:hypothetical protein